jgi:hypothetical protein
VNARALGLLAAPALTAAFAVAAPRLVVSDGVAAALTFGGAAAAALVALVLAARSALDGRAAVALGAAALALLGLVLLAAPPPPIAVTLVNLALVAVAHAVGGSIGRRVAHPGHLLPACAVAAAADLLSVVHPSGPSHAIAGSERALSLLAVGFPIPGTRAVAPSLGLGDLVFLALVFGVVAAHGLSMARAAAAAAVGLAVAGALSALLAAAIPALLPVGAAVVAGIPEARRLRPEDRRTATFAIAAAAAVVAGVLLSPR